MLEAAVQWPWLNLSANSIPDILECRAQEDSAPTHTPAPSSPAVATTAAPPCEPATTSQRLATAIPADAARQRLYLQQLVRAAYAATLKTQSSGNLNHSLGESACRLEAFAAALRAQDSMQRAKMDRIRDWARDVAAATAAAEETETAAVPAPVIQDQVMSHFGVGGGGSHNVANTEGTDSEKRTLTSLNLTQEPCRTVPATVSAPAALQAAAALRALAALAAAAKQPHHHPNHAVDHAFQVREQLKKLVTARLQAACSVAPPAGPTFQLPNGISRNDNGAHGPHGGCGPLTPLDDRPDCRGGAALDPDACPRQMSLMPTPAAPVPEADHKLQPRQSSPTPRVIKTRGSMTSWSSIDTTAAVITPPPLHQNTSTTTTPSIMENYHPAGTPLDLVAVFAKKRRRRADSMPSTPRERDFKTLKTLKDENSNGGLSRSNSTRARLLSPVQAYPSPQASPVLEGNALGLSGVQLSSDDNDQPRFGLGLLSPSA